MLGLRNEIIRKLYPCKKNDPARTRTWNPLIRSQMPYPLGHRATTPFKPCNCYIYAIMNKLLPLHNRQRQTFFLIKWCII